MNAHQKGEQVMFVVTLELIALACVDSGFLIVLCFVAIFTFVYQTDKLIWTGKYFPAATGSYDLSERGNYEKGGSYLTARVTAIATC